MVPCVADLPGCRAPTLIKFALMIQGITVRPLPARIAQVSVSTWMDGRRLDVYLEILLSMKTKCQPLKAHQFSCRMRFFLLASAAEV